MKLVKRISLIIILLVICNCLNSTYCYAAPTTPTASSITSNASNLLNVGSSLATKVQPQAVVDVVSFAFSVLTTIGIFIITIVTIYMGIAYMTSPPQRQAALRGQMIGLLIAAIVVIGAYGIWNAFVTLFK